MVVFYTVSLIVLAAALGIFSNWFDRPRGITNPRLAAIVVAVVATMVIVTLLQGSSAGEPAAAAEPPAPQSKGHSLAAWEDDVNSVCGPVTTGLAAEKNRYGHADPSDYTEAEGMEYLHTVSKRIGPLLRDLNQLEMPTGQQGRVKANGWLQAYRNWYTAFVAVLARLDDSMDASLFEQILNYSGDRGAATKFSDATAQVQGRGAALGLECPFSDVTK